MEEIPWNENKIREKGILKSCLMSPTLGKLSLGGVWKRSGQRRTSAPRALLSTSQPGSWQKQRRFQCA